MALLLNLHRLEEDAVHLQGELPTGELELDHLDELVHPAATLQYDLWVQMMESGLLVQGSLRLALNCECARCLRPFQQVLEFKDWACHLAIEGEESVPVVNDSVDLTPQIREHMVLEFPSHPVCGSECRGWPQDRDHGQRKEGSAATLGTASPWAELDKLKLDKD